MSLFRSMVSGRRISRCSWRSDTSPKAITDFSERNFRAAVEANPSSSEAWLGLAASYDRLRRFDLAERAYRRVLSLEGRNAAVLNNLGYHHMLRGNLKKARAYLQEAVSKDPGNPLIQGNLYLLETWKGTGGPGHMLPERG